MNLATKVTLGQTGIEVTKVGFGVHPLGPSRKNLSIEKGSDLMVYAYEKGIRFFDTAQFYQTYEYIEKTLEKIKKSPCFDTLPVISSKSLEEDYDGMMEAVEEARQKTGLEVIDIFLLHQMEPGDFEARTGAWKALLDTKAAGKVKAIGISTHHQDIVLEASTKTDLDVVFALYNYTGLGIRNGEKAGTPEGMLAALRSCTKNGKGIYTMKVFGGGNLTCSYQKAAKHVFFDCQDVIPSAMIGFTDEREVDELDELLQGFMDPDYNPPTDDKKLRVDREDCMGCGSCVRICASGAMHYSRVDGLAEIDYGKCVGCNYCAIACPQRAIVLW